MVIKKGLTPALAALFFATIIVLGAVIQGTAGGGPLVPPYAAKIVGPEISGLATLVPGSDNMSFNASMDGTCAGKKVKLTGKINTQKPADSLSDKQITTSATKYYLPAGAVKMTGQGCAPAAGSGDLMIEEIKDLQVQRDKNNKIKQINFQAKLTFIMP